MKFEETPLNRSIYVKFACPFCGNPIEDRGWVEYVDDELEPRSECSCGEWHGMNFIRTKPTQAEEEASALKREERNRKVRERREQKERAEYERLKAKFETKEDDGA